MKFTKKVSSHFDYYEIKNFFLSGIDKEILHDSNHFDFYQIEKTRTSNNNRIWMHKHSFASFQECATLLNSNWFKQKIGDTLGIDCTTLRSRVELCKDAKGSWLEEHTDDPAKIVTLQIYLTNSGSSTILANNLSESISNTGWLFKNTGTEWHSLNPLNENRTSIILNYVNDTWRDKTVLI